MLIYIELEELDPLSPLFPDSEKVRWLAGHSTSHLTALGIILIVLAILGFLFVALGICFFPTIHLPTFETEGLKEADLGVPQIRRSEEKH